MYAQALEVRGTSDDLSELVCRELIPALRSEPGFSGALSLVDREAQTMLVLVFWETEEQAARRLPPRFTPLLAGLGMTDAATYAPQVWEVGARA
ncbi:MAG TPA: hypothetical protein VFU30_09525 [Gaiellaceae bacterium]|nr:hypothetical protein [Gaiellaceae bacterium]